jgi:hypothetical protein
MSLTLEELALILDGPAGLDTTKDPVTGVPEKLGELMAQINGVSDEQILADLGPAIFDSDGDAVHEPGESADPDDVVVPAKGVPFTPKYRPPKTAQDIVNESKIPQLNLATVIDAYIRLVITEVMDGGGPGAGGPGTGDTDVS